jgi:glycosyltransferase involved in cell wall biosynthesis
MRIAVWWEQALWGGVDTHLLSLLRNWPDKSDQFIIFYNNDNQGMKRISASLCQLDQVKVVSFPDSSSFLPEPLAKVARYFFLPLRFLLMKRRAQRLLACHGPFDVLLANNGGYPGAWGSLAALWAGAALRLHIRLLLVHHEAMARGPLRYSFESLLDLGVQHWATDLVAVSRATRTTLIERRGFYNYLNPIRVIHNGVDQSTEVGALAVDLRVHLAIPADSFVIGMVGRLERYKGHEDLILALSELPFNKLSRVVAVFVGGGDDAERERLEIVALKIGVLSQVRFAGYVEGDIGLLMRQFDLLAMLTKDFEGFGLTIAEAMWAGTPVLATMVGAVPEFVTEDLAIMVQPEAPDEIAAALLRIMDKPEEAQERASRAQQHISKYTSQAMARKFHRLMLVSGR